jgi:hypothetical protein
VGIFIRKIIVNAAEKLGKANTEEAFRVIAGGEGICNSRPYGDPECRVHDKRRLKAAARALILVHDLGRKRHDALAAESIAKPNHASENTRAAKRTADDEEEQPEMISSNRHFAPLLRHQSS